MRFFVAYGTRPGAVAWESAGRNSYFTAALLPDIESCGMEKPVQQLIAFVRKRVLGSTDQLVEVRDQLVGDVFLLPSLSARGPASKRARRNEEEGES